MIAPPCPQFAVEIYPDNWNFPAGNSWIAGWIQPAAGQVITDVRARLHHRVILGLFGLPHPAFTENHSGQSGTAGPGFSFLLSPQPRATLLRLEARDRTGQWREFFRTPIAAAATAATPASTLNLSTSLGALTTALLKQRLRTPQRTWSELADELMAAFVAEPLDSHPNVPFLGTLEEPHVIGRLRYGRIPITGWLAHPSAKITRLSAVIDPLPKLDLPHGLARSDISGAFPSLRDQPHSAFVGEIALPVGLATPVLLKIFAELDHGERHLVFARRFIPQLHGDSGQIPRLTTGREIARALWALFHSAGRHGLSRQNFLRSAQKIWAANPASPAYRSDTFWPSPDENFTRHPVPLPPAQPALTLIDSADDMGVPDISQYFSVGREALILVQEAVAQAGGGRVESILDLPSGFGRVARWFRTAYPAAKLSVCDTQRPGVDFCVQQLNATGVQATLDGSHWAALPGPYDIIWCGSLLTHFDQDQWITHLRRFHERLTPHGVLVFTSHGLLALDIVHSGEKDYGLPPPDVARLCHDAATKGFGYVDYTDTPGYGISIAQPGWIREVIERETELEIIAVRAAAWGQHQDVIVCRRQK